MRVLVLGAGFGGLELTSRLSEEFGDAADVVLIDKSDGFVFGFSKLEVMFGREDPAAVHHAYAGLVKPGVTFVQATIQSIDPVAKRVETDAGAFDADILVVALGADLDPAATPGLVEGGNEFYTVEGAFALRDVLAAFDGGRVVVGVTSLPFKCPPAPSETALLMHDFLTARGARDRSTISLVMPLPVPIPPSPAASELLLGAFAERGIDWYPQRLVGSPSTRPARWPSSATAPSCPTTSSSASPSTGRRPWWWRPGMTVDGWIPVDSLTLETSYPGGLRGGRRDQRRHPQGRRVRRGPGRGGRRADHRRHPGRRGVGPSTAGGACATWSSATTRSPRSTSPSSAARQPTGDLVGPSPAYVADKVEFGRSRIARWFGS